MARSTEGRILVWEDKHSTSYYNASTPEKLEESARMILEVLTGDYGYIQDPGTELSEWDTNRLNMEFVEIDESAYIALPEALQIPIKHEKKKYAKLMADLKARQDDYKLACDLASGKVAGAWRYLQGRSGYEYEIYSLEYLEN